MITVATNHLRTYWMSHGFARLYFTVRLVIVIGLLFDIRSTIHRNHDEAVAGRREIIALQNTSELSRIAASEKEIEMISDFEVRTAKRWNWLAEKNQSLNVPKVVEPIDGIDPGPLQR